MTQGDRKDNHEEQLPAPKGEAACNNPEVNKDIFMSDEPLDRVQALRICGSCAINQKCLEDALKLPFSRDHGIKAGYSRVYRQMLRDRSRNS